jgi:hypothetical protein
MFYFTMDTYKEVLFDIFSSQMILVYICGVSLHVVEICVANLEFQYDVSLQNIYLSAYIQYHIHVYSLDDVIFNELNVRCQS